MPFGDDFPHKNHDSRVRSQWGRYNLPRMIYSMYSNWPSCHTSQSKILRPHVSPVIYVWRQVMPGADRGVGPQNEHLTGKTKKNKNWLAEHVRHTSRITGSAPVDLERDRLELKVTANHLGSNAKSGPKRIKHGVSLTSDWFIVISFIL